MLKTAFAYKGNKAIKQVMWGGDSDSIGAAKTMEKEVTQKAKATEIQERCFLSSVEACMKGRAWGGMQRPPG